MNSYPRDVIDERGYVHVLRPPPLGEGGQGIVFATQHPDVAVKLISGGIRNAGGSSLDLLDRLTQGFGTRLAEGDAAHRQLRSRLEEVRTLRLPDLNLAQPLAMLRGHVGYTMRLLRDMVPIRELLPAPGSENVSAAYLDTGGLRRRLRLLAKTAETLARLHAVPLVYSDVSPNNVFVSKEIKASEVWLIDADNLHFQTMPGPSIHTPGFGAPEVVAGRATVTTLSDVYAFSVLAFYVVAQVHPFLGNQVEEGGWDASVDLEERAFAGDLPWVEDENDDSNWTDNGIPRELVLTPSMRRLFQETLGPGRSDPLRRPSMLAWAETLHQCADLTVRCPSCNSTFYAPMRRCPWCAESPSADLLYIEFRAWDPELDAETYDSVLKAPPVWRMCMDLGEPAFITRHSAAPSLMRDGDPPVLKVEVRPKAVRITPEGDQVFHAVLPYEKRTEVIDTTKDLPLPLPGREWHLHFGLPEEPHRLGSFKLIRSAKG